MMFTDLVEFLIASQLWMSVRLLVSVITRVLLLTGIQATLRNPVGFKRRS